MTRPDPELTLDLLAVDVPVGTPRQRTLAAIIDPAALAAALRDARAGGPATRGELERPEAIADHVNCPTCGAPAGERWPCDACP